MGKSKSLVKNLGWQTAYQVLATCMPLITAPYLSRVLGAESLGVFSFTYSLALFFRLFGLLGNFNYGTREIAKLRNEESPRSRIFKEIIIIQSITTVIALVAYYAYCFIFESASSISIIQSIWIIDCFFNISWLYSGMEEFKYMAIRGVLIKLLQLGSILLFVKTTDHVGRYALIMSISAVLSNLILWIGIGKRVNLKEKINPSDIKRHIKPTLLLFIPVAASSVFRLMDKLMLGKMSTEVQSGYYYNADHLINIPILVITGLCTVMLSRMSSIKSDPNKYDALFNTYTEIIMIVAVAMAAGIGAIAPEFVPFFFGNEFVPCVGLVYIFSFVMVFKAASNLIMSMHLIPMGKDRIYVYSVLVGAGVNVVCNVFFIAIFKLGALGATLGTLIAEFSLMLVELILTRKTIGIGKMASKVLPYMVIGGIMFAIVRVIAKLLNTFAIHVVAMLSIEIVVGAVSFLLLTLLFVLVSKRFERIKKGVLGGTD